MSTEEKPPQWAEAKALKLIEEMGDAGYDTYDLSDQWCVERIAAALVAERERCAGVVDGWRAIDNLEAVRIATAIRNGRAPVSRAILATGKITPP